MSTWLRRALRTVLPAGMGPIAPTSPIRKLIRWRMDEPPPDSQTAWRDTDFDASYAQTRPMADEIHGWLTSSMDLVTGVEVKEADDDAAQFARYGARRAEADVYSPRSPR